MLQEKDAFVSKFSVALDALAISAAFVLAYFVKTKFGSSLADILPFASQATMSFHLSTSEFIVFLLIALTIWSMVLYFYGMYRPVRSSSYLEILWGLFRGTLVAFLCLAALLFLFKVRVMSRAFFVLGMGFGFLFLLIEKTAVYVSYHYVKRQGYSSRRLLIVGTGRRAAAFLDKIDSHPKWGLQVIGLIDDEPGHRGRAVDPARIIGTLDNIQEIFHRDAVDEVVFVVPRSRLSALQGAILDCETEGVSVTIAIDLFDTNLGRSSVTSLDGTPLLHFKTTFAKEWQLFIKRVLDILVSGVGLVLLSPMFLVVAVLIKWTSRGPVFFKQARLGLHGRIFKLYKFRTMRNGAHGVLSKVSDLREMDTPEFREKKLQWMTPIGRILRKFSIDELPQLINVFIGQMSLVGPRPTVPDEVEKYKTWQRRRLSVKPGITCLWQINGRNKIGFEEWMEMDLKYLDNWSLWLDFTILVRTVPVVLFGIGAY